VFYIFPQEKKWSEIFQESTSSGNLKNNLGLCKFTSIIPATWEAEIRGLQSEARVGKNVSPYLIKTNKS
jgi:hypothetical protein